MEKNYDDFLLPENFELIAKEYSKKLKSNDFVFISLKEEAFDFLVNEILILIGKMKACLERLNLRFDSQKLHSKLDFCENQLVENFGKRKPRKFVCVVDENAAFFALIACQNTLYVKLSELAFKSEKIKLCHDIMLGVSLILSESFSCDGFLPC